MEELREVIVDNFRSGMVTNIDPSERNLFSFKEILNARIDQEEGSLVKRLPSTKYNETSLGSSPINSGYRYYYGSSSKELIINYETILKKGDDSAGTFSNIKTGLTSGTKFSFLTYKDKLYWCNGTDNNMRYDGTNVRDMGLPAPTSAPSLNTKISGSLSGDYYYKVTYQYDGYQESNPSSASSKITYSSEGGKINIPTSADPACTGRKLYRTTAGGSVYYLVSAISNNTDTTYDDTTVDGSLGAQIETNHDIPPKWKMMVLHKDRIFGLKPDSCEIDYTPIDNYVSYPDMYDSTVNYEIVAEDDGEKVKAIVAVDEGILCFKDTKTYIIRTYNNDPNAWEIDLIDEHGTCCPWAVVPTDKGVVYVERNKYLQKDLRILAGTSRSASVPIGFRIKDILDTFKDQQLDDVKGIFYGGRVYLSYTDNYSGLEQNNKILILQLAKGLEIYGYTVDNTRIGCFIPAMGSADDGQMYIGASNEGRVLRVETPSSDIVHKIKTDIDTGAFTRIKESGTDDSPEFHLDESTDWSGEFSSLTINDMTQTIDSYTTLIDYNGYIESDVLYIGAISLTKLYWSAALGANGASGVKLRTGDTIAACQSASWSSLFTDSSGSDISGVSAKKYIQYRMYLFSDDLPDADTKFYRNNYVIKISAGLGSPFEDAINFVLNIGLRDLGFKGLIKRIRQVVIEYSGGSGQTLYVYGNTNEDTDFTEIEQVDLGTYPNLKQIILPFSYIGEYFNLKLVEESLSSFKIKSIRIVYSVLPKKAYNLRR